MIAPDVPPPDEVTAPWWAATTRRRLLVQGCADCPGHAQHPPRALCLACGSTDQLTWCETPGTGVVDTFTVVHRAPRPEMEVPYVVARVRLDGPGDGRPDGGDGGGDGGGGGAGVVLLTRLEGHDPQSWTIGDPVRVNWVPLPDGRALPVFVPAPGGSGPVR